MTDLDLITQLRPDVPLATPGELAHARARLTAGIIAPASFTGAGDRAGRNGGQDAGTSQRRPLWSPRRLGLTAAAAAAAAGTVAALVAVPGHGGRPAAARVQAGATTSPYVLHPGPATSPFTGHLTLASFLHAAARAALRQPATPPGPNQFVYGQTATTGQGSRTSKYQSWLSADGARAGLVIQPGHYRLSPCTVTAAEAGRCSVSNGYLPGLPSRPTAALAYLVKIKVLSQADLGSAPGYSSSWVANDVGKELGSMLSSMYLLPGQRAALYEIMASIKGFRVVPHASLLGRKGIGVAWTYEGAGTTLVFSPRNYAYLGSVVTFSHHRGVFTTALAELGVVNRVGELP